MTSHGATERCSRSLHEPSIRHVVTRFTAVLAALMLPGALLAQDPVDHAIQAWSKVHTIRGNFEQTITNSLVGGTASSRGHFQQQRPGRLSIRFTQPSGDAIVADGQSVWIYLPSSSPGRVVRRSAVGGAATPIDFTAQFLDAPRAKYDITDAGRQTIDGRAVHVLKFTPKAGASSPFVRGQVWVDDDDGLIRQFEVTESNGITRRVHLTDLTVNGRVDAGAFRFKVPKGVKIVDG